MLVIDTTDGGRKVTVTVTTANQTGSNTVKETKIRFYDSSQKSGADRFGKLIASAILSADQAAELKRNLP